MNEPRFSIIVNSITSGWSYATYQGEEPDPETPVLLGDGLTYAWAFENDQIPGHLEPATAGVTFVALTAGDLPAAEIGDLIRIRIRIGLAGPMILDETFRSAEPVVTLRPGKPRAAVLQLTLTDTLADLASRFPTKHPQPTQDSFLFMLASLRSRSDVALGRPTAWNANVPNINVVGSSIDDDNDQPIFPANWGDDAALSIVRSTLNTYAPLGIHHTIVPNYGPAHPAGYEQVAAAWVNNGNLTDPVTDLRFEVTPASRKITGAVGLPLRLGTVGGLTTLVGVENAAQISRLVPLSAAWCELPATARKSREHAVTVLKIEGYEYKDAATFADAPTSQSTERSLAGAAAAGAVSRSIQTQQCVIDSDEMQYFVTRPAAAATRIASIFLPDETVFAARWSFDAFTVKASLMPQAVAEKLLPLLVRGRADTDLVRHLTLYGIPEDAQLDGRNYITGFLSSGQLDVLGGDLTFTLTSVPGLPELDDQANSISWADLAASTYEPTTWETLDPDLTAADFRLVRN